MTRQDVFNCVKREYKTEPDDEIKSLIDLSYELAAAKKKRSKEISNGRCNK